jgi:hypothetical protein
MYQIVYNNSYMNTTESKTTGFRWNAGVGEGDRNKGGRPSKVKKVMEMNLDDFYKGAGEEGGTLGGTSRALMGWLGSQGMSITEKTCMRVVKQLITSGAIEVVSRGKNKWDGWVIKPAVLSSTNQPVTL